MPITVSIVESDRRTREHLTNVVDSAPALRCLHACASGEEALKRISRHQPDVVLMEIDLPDISGSECVARIREHAPDSQVLVFSRREESEAVFEALRAGANGYLTKNASGPELVQAVEQIQAGGSPMSPAMTRKVVNRLQQQNQRPVSPFERLSRREREILTLLAEGHLYTEIAQALGISLSTVRAHVHSVYSKLGVRSRTQAVVQLLRRNSHRSERGAQSRYAADSGEPVATDGTQPDDAYLVVSQ